MKNYSLFIIGIMMLVFAGMFHIFRHGKSMQKAPPPKPTLPPMPAKAKPASLAKTGQPEAPQIAAGTKELENSIAKENTVAPSAKGSSTSASSGSSASASSTSASSTSASSTSASTSVQSASKTESTGAQSQQEIVADEKK
jgi:ubiquinol-cytochrome c reductase cytochrome b subunit